MVFLLTGFILQQNQEVTGYIADKKKNVILAPVIRHHRLSCDLCCQQTPLFQVQEAPLLIQFAVNVPGKAAIDVPKCLSSCTHGRPWMKFQVESFTLPRPG